MNHNRNEAIRALRLINNAGRGLTHTANVLVSRNAAGLLSAGLIRYASNKYAGYSLTKAGMDLL